MIEYDKQSTENYHNRNKRRKAERIFMQSIMNEDLTKATFDNYNPTNSHLEYAKNLCERFANNFTLDNNQSLLIQGSFGTGKS
ncbi:DNA replication protein DnaC, partial [Staphylococcus aureus]|nr:DNA replication protein DnaC [Staphylococcus aureus]